MRILHVIPTLDPAHGGPPVVAARLAAAQAAAGHEVALLTADAPSAHAAVWDGVPAADRVARVDRLTPADHLHLHGVWGGLLRQTAAAARRAGVPYAVAPHGMLDPWSLSQKPLKKRLGLLLGYRRMLDGAAFLHALNGDEAQLWAPLELRPPGRVFPNGIFPAEVDPPPQPGGFRAAHPELSSDPFCLFLGRLHHKKGLDVLADAFAAVPPPCRLVVAGPDGGAGDDFRRRVATVPGLAGRVHVVGPVYGPAKFAALADAAVFCLPSRQEGFSVAVLEAMASGTPVVVSDACHFPEVATAGAGLVVPLTATAVAAAVTAVVSDAGRALAMGRAGRALVLSRYTWPTIAEQLALAYAGR